MKIELKKLNALQHAVLPFSEVIDLKDEKMYGRNPFQSPVYVEGEVSNESGVLRLKGSIRAVYSTECARCLKPLDIPLEAEADMILSDDPEAEEEDLKAVTEGIEDACGRMDLQVTSFQGETSCASEQIIVFVTAAGRTDEKNGQDAELTGQSGVEEPKKHKAA